MQGFMHQLSTDKHTCMEAPKLLAHCSYFSSHPKQTPLLQLVLLNSISDEELTETIGSSAHQWVVVVVVVVAWLAPQT